MPMYMGSLSLLGGFAHVMKTITAFLLLLASAHLACAVSHFSIFTTNDLSFKRPLDEKSGVRLVSIATNGLVTIKRSDGTVLSARLGDSKTFRNSYGHTTDIELLSVSKTRDSVVIRFEMRVYVAPPNKGAAAPMRVVKRVVEFPPGFSR